MKTPSFLSGESRTRLLQGIAIGFALTVAIGFNWTGYGFGWVTGGTAEKMANDRTQVASIAILAPACVAKFNAQPDVAARKVAMQELKEWQRADSLPKEWATLPGESYPNSSLARACVDGILKPQTAALK